MAEVGRFRRRGRPFDFARGAPSSGRYPPDELAIPEATEAIRSAPVEIGYGFDVTGRQVFRQVGDAEEIRGFEPRDLAAIADGTFVHSHPPYTQFPEGDPRRRVGSFSPRDLAFMYENRLDRIIAVTAERTYDLRWRPEGSYLDPDEINAEYRRYAALVENDLLLLASRGMILPEEAEAEGRIADEVMDRLAGFFNYGWMEVSNDAPRS